jgi:uncharacterized protein (TIGR02646 family)
MRSLTKTNEPASLTAWKDRANEEWQPVYPDLRGAEKLDLHRSLLSEQAWLCCYCGRSIDEGDSHIEHFRPQESYSSLQLEYDNLHASCIRETAPGTPLHCGHAKGGAFDEERQLSPLDTAVEARFRYRHDGAIVPSAGEDDGAAYMINLLRLDSPALTDGRLKAIVGVFDDSFVATASNEEIEAIAESFTQPDASGRLPAFAHAIASLAWKLLGR